MHVGIITYDFSPPIGGLGSVAVHQVQMLRKAFPQNRYTVFSPSAGADDRVSILASMRWKKKGGCPLFSLLLAFRIEGLIRRYGLDLLHVHAGSGGVFLFKKPSRPVVVTAHHSYLQEVELVYARHPVRRLWKRWMAFLEKRTYAFADRIICVSRDTADVVVHRMNIPQEKVTVIENGIHRVSELPQEERDPLLVLYVGRLEERKGIWVLLKAFEEVRRKVPHARLRLAGENLLGGALRQYIGAQGLGGAVSVMGYLHSPMLRREMLRAAVLVVPSLVEGFGLIAAEAMLLGTCVVVSDCPGLRSIVTHGKTGLVFRSQDPHDCAACIVRALSDRELRMTLEAEAKREAMERFSPGARTGDLQRVFDVVVQRKQKNK